jgi:hypothetical protein
MINKFKYSYISYENDTPWNEDPVVDLSLSYSSYNMDYNFNSNEQLSKNKGFIKSLLENKNSRINNLILEYEDKMKQLKAIQNN